MELCSICNGSEFKKELTRSDIYHIECSTCGEYSITWEANEQLQKSSYKKDCPKISACLRQRTVRGLKSVTIFRNKEIAADKSVIAVTIEDLIREFPATIADRVDNAIINLSKMSRFTGDSFEITSSDYPLFYTDSTNIKSMEFMIEQVYQEGYIFNTSFETKPPLAIAITAKGWNRVSELEKYGKKNAEQAFVAMWFEESMKEIYEKNISRAIKDAKYKPFIISMKEHNGDITDEIIAEIRSSKFLVADFTGQRGGVYFESGFAYGLGLPVIWTCREDWFNKVVDKEVEIKIGGKIKNGTIKEDRYTHFDINHYNFIIWNNGDDLYEKLFNRIRATIV